MSMTVSHSREVNILNPNIAKQFGITNIEKQIYIRDEDDIFFDIFHEDLYTFSMNWKDYEEYISQVNLSNWNSEENTISFKEIWSDSETITIYVDQGGGCLKCKAWHSKESSKNMMRTCLECGYIWDENEFE